MPKTTKEICNEWIDEMIENLPEDLWFSQSEVDDIVMDLMIKNIKDNNTYFEQLRKEFDDFVTEELGCFCSDGYICEYHKFVYDVFSQSSPFKSDGLIAVEAEDGRDTKCICGHSFYEHRESRNKNSKGKYNVLNCIHSEYNGGVEIGCNCKMFSQSNPDEGYAPEKETESKSGRDTCPIHNIPYSVGGLNSDTKFFFCIECERKISNKVIK